MKELIGLENFSVAISFKGSLGWVEYDEAARKVIVTLGTGVHVDWSRPVDYVKLHPHY